MRRSWILLGLLLVFVPAAPAPAADKLPKKKLHDLATRWFKARPKTHFVRWDRAVRTSLLNEAEALGELPKGALDDVVAIFWKAVKKHGPSGKGKIDTPYGEATWIQKGRGGPKSGLVLGLHGGGVGAGSASEPAGTWTPPKHMGMYPQGIRLIHDTWNSVHGERFLLTLIEIAKARYGIDPDRVYSMGFSMGGTGSMFMAGRHPDLLAGAIPAHGVVPAKKVKVKSWKDTGPLEHGLLPNLRNVAVYFYTGADDVNCEPGTFVHAWRILEELRKGDRTGYELLRFEEHPKLAHSFPPGEPSKGMKWVTAQRRQPFPERLVWVYNANPWPQPDGEDKVERRPKRWFYWLHCVDPRDRMKITVDRKGNTFDLTADIAFPDDCTVYLSDRMIDPDEEVVLQVAGKEVWRGRPKATYATVLESLDARLDRTMVFDRKVRFPE